jgi:23S rRNA (uracil1939-C5)-methyltransferase
LGKRSKKARYRGPDLTSHLSLEKGQELTFDLRAIGDDGYATAEHDGVPVSVMGGLEGEQVTASVIWVAKDRVYAKVESVRANASERRVSPPCPYFLACTGCQWQHVSYDHQLELKRDRVVNELRKYAELAGIPVEPTLPSPLQLGYRNHARFTVARWPENRGQVGYMNAITRRFVRVDRCLLMDEQVNAILQQMQGRMDGMSQVSVRVGVNTGSTLVQPKLPPQLAAVPSGQTHYEEEVNGATFRVASPSFFQVNTAQLARMAAAVKEMLGLDGSGTLVDAYSGVGVFAILLAPYVERVIAVEESPSSVADACANAAGLTNIEFVQGKSEEVMPALAGTADFVILDPPRAGCMPAALDAVARMRPRKVAMVSCEPSALARDLAHLTGRGFKLVRVQPVDMFPQTRHVEALALLEPLT